MIVDVFSLYPDFLNSFISDTYLCRAVQKGLVTINPRNYRDFGIGRHKQVDDTIYGGGAGMLLRADVVIPAIESVLTKQSKIIMMSPAGKRLTQTLAKECAGYEHVVIICGHYEGIDNRVMEYFNPEIISVGDYVLTNGLLAACVLLDAALRHVAGVLGNEDSLQHESFNEGQGIECPHYTKPRIFKNLAVPDVLLSGNHEQIELWRKSHSGTLS